MKDIIVIGDTHGKVDKYNTILKRNPKKKTIQVGDFGFKNEHLWHSVNVDPEQHKVLFGNHDDYTCLGMPHSLGDFGRYDDDIFYIRGAHSIDRAYRIMGRDWWKEEEMNHCEWTECMKDYEEMKPSVVISHTCPTRVKEEVWGFYQKSVTCEWMDACLEIHKPDIWIYGHFHKSSTELIDDTLFICLAELETYEL